MDRGKFLKSLLAIGVSAAIPKFVLPVTDFIERKEIQDKTSRYPIKAMMEYANRRQFVNHMTIQRRTVSITSEAQSKVISVNYNQ
jgi:hypothetical protein